MVDTPLLDSTMFHHEAGTGTPFVFLHGNPTSSHLWRNVTPQVGPGVRVLAPDLIGMGRSGKPDIAYGFADHARYLDAWFDVLGLNGIVLVGHDWGGALALDWAARHPGRVRAIAFLETIVRPFTWADFPGEARPRLEALRGEGSGEAKVLDQNFFMEVALKATVLDPLAEADLAIYRAPYVTRESRRPLLAWPRAFPIDGEPADVAARVEAYDAWLAASADIPKLLMTFAGSPTLVIDDGIVAWCRDNIAALEIVPCGPAGHLAPEDQPNAIAAAVSAWADRHGLRDESAVRAA